MSVTLRPIVAVVDEWTLAWIESSARAMDFTPLADAMLKNGWTAEALCAGALIRACLAQDVPKGVMPSVTP